MLGDVLGKYMSDIQEINEGTTTEHNLKTVQSIVVFPFMYIHLQDQKQVSFIMLNKFQFLSIMYRSFNYDKFDK